MYRKRVWDINSNAYQDAGPANIRPLAPGADRPGQALSLRGLGQDDGGFDWGALSQIISAGTVGAANVIKAVNAPYAPTTVSPTSAGYQMPSAGVGQTLYPAATVSASGGSSTLVLAVGGVAVVLVLMLLLRK